MGWCAVVASRPAARGRLFPTKDDDLLRAAAKRGRDLEGAVFEVLSDEAPHPDGLAVQGATAAGPSAPAVPVAAVPAGEARLVPTAFVTTGSCSYGVCFDVAAKDRPVTITALHTASSPGLNWGQGGKIRAKVFTTQGSSRGKELQPGLWTQVGNEDAIQLPLVSWVDADNPEYGRIELNSPVAIAPGETFGFLVHTSDLYGLVTSQGAGAGGSMEMWDEEEMGGAFRVRPCPPAPHPRCIPRSQRADTL